MTTSTGPVGDRRLVVMLSHATHTAIGVLLVVAVTRSWVREGGANGRWWSTLVAAAALAVTYAAGVALAGPARRAQDARGEHGSAAAARGAHWWVAALVTCWAAGCLVADGFAWVAFPVFFLVLMALPRPPALVTLAAMALWTILAGRWRDGTDVGASVGSWLGPIVGALVALLGHAVFEQLRRDAVQHRALVDELRAAQADLAATEHANGVMAERERLAREIHDTIGQGLASIVVLARTAAPGDRRALNLIESTARDNLAEARRFIRDLGSAGEVTLESTLRSLTEDARARSLASGHPVEVSLDVTGTPPTHLDSRIPAALQRGVQASLANVLQHSGASRCAVGLTWFDEQVVVDVVDDGVGFDPAAVDPDAHYGLRALRDRLADLGGRLTVDSAPGEGATVALAIPLRGAP